MVERTNRMKPVFLRVCGYVLELEEGYYYVGTTLNLNQRLSQHWDGDGSLWTQLHKPHRLLEVVFDVNEEWENETTLLLMEELGEDKVRGGAWCRVELEKEYEDPTLLSELKELSQKLSDALEECCRLSQSLHIAERHLSGETLSDSSESQDIPQTE